MSKPEEKKSPNNGAKSAEAPAKPKDGLVGVACKIVGKKFQIVRADRKDGKVEETALRETDNRTLAATWLTQDFIKATKP